MRTEIETFADLSDPKSKLALLAAVRPLSGWYSIELHPRRDTLTNQQRRFFHGVIVRDFHKFRLEQGESYTFDECKQFLKARLLKETFIDKATGEIMGDFVRSTESLDIAEYSAFIEKCLAFLAEFGIVIDDHPPQPAATAAEKDFIF